MENGNLNINTCPKCSSDDLKVLDTRAGKVASTRRRRECQNCGHRFSTIEEILREDLVVVKRDGRRESFDRTKLAMGLRRAIAKRPIDAEQINALLSQTLRQIENEFDGEVQPGNCGCNHAKTQKCG